MKKIISFLVIAILSMTTIANVNAFWTYADKTHLNINWKHIITWKQVYIDWELDNIVYFHIRNVLSDWKNEYKYYNYTNWELKEVEEFEDNKMDLSDSENWTISQHYNQENDLENYTTKISIDGKEYWPYNYDYIEMHDISNKAFWYKYWEGRDDMYQLFFYPENEIKSNPKVDKLLSKIFSKIDKKWDLKAKKVYQGLVSRIDLLLEKNKNSKNKELLEYIKYKVLDKINE